MDPTPTRAAGELPPSWDQLEPSEPAPGTGCQECGNDDASTVLGAGTPYELALCSDCLELAQYAGGEAATTEEGTT